MKKLIAVGIIILLVGMSIPSTGSLMSDDDTIPPMIENFEWELNVKEGRWAFLGFTICCYDYESGMNRVEFYKDDVLIDTINGSGPDYYWEMPYCKYLVRGIILNPENNEKYTEFFAVIVLVRTVPYYSIGKKMIIKAVAYDNAGNSAFEEIRFEPWNTNEIESGIYMFQNLKFPNNYKGIIGNFLIFANFCVI